MDERICFLIGAGDAAPAAPRPAADDLVIAADAGVLRCRAWGIVPALCVGDFDSLGFVPDGETVVLPRRKDDTDMRAAAFEGLKRGYRRFCLCGATGGRADHSLANLQLLHELARSGAVGCLWGERFVTAVIPPSRLTFPAGGRGWLSLFCFAGEACRASVTGAAYEGRDLTLTPFHPLGVSNEFTGAPVTVECREGFLTILWEHAAVPFPAFTASGEEP